MKTIDIQTVADLAAYLSENKLRMQAAFANRMWSVVLRPDDTLCVGLGTGTTLGGALKDAIIDLEQS